MMYETTSAAITSAQNHVCLKSRLSEIFSAEYAPPQEATARDRHTPGRCTPGAGLNGSFNYRPCKDRPPGTIPEITGGMIQITQTAQPAKTLSFSHLVFDTQSCAEE